MPASRQKVALVSRQATRLTPNEVRMLVRVECLKFLREVTALLEEERCERGTLLTTVRSALKRSRVSVSKKFKERLSAVEWALKIKQEKTR